MARSTGAEVVAVHAMGTPVFADGFFVAGASRRGLATGVEKWDAYVRETLEKQWCRPLEGMGVRFRAETVNGNTEAPITLADELDADMLVVGREIAAGSRSSSWAASVTSSCITLTGRSWSCRTKVDATATATAAHRRRTNRRTCPFRDVRPHISITPLLA